MQRIASRNVWVYLSSGQRTAVIEEFLRILTEEVEHERFREDPGESFESAGRRLSNASGKTPGQFAWIVITGRFSFAPVSAKARSTRM
jgi:hypothetical protein